MLSPSSIAIIGASQNYHHNSGRVIVNLQKSHYSGKLYLVNPNNEKISGLSSYSSLSHIEDEVDLACIVVHYSKVIDIVKECVAKKVKSIVVISSGFSESGEEGIQREKELKKIIENSDTVLYGPNAPGFSHFQARWGISFSPRFEPRNFKPGSVGVISHGGSLGRAVLDANEKGVGFSYWFSPGNEVDVSLTDCFQFLLEDETTKVIVFIIEGIREEEVFFRLLHEAYLKGKPVIFFSVGHSEISRQAVVRHLGQYETYAFPLELISHPGLIKVDSLSEIVAISWLFDCYKKAKGKRTIIFSWAGANSIYLTDLCVKYGIELSPLSEALDSELKKLTGLKKDFMNPVDLTTTVYNNLDILTQCLDLISESEEFDNVIIPFPFQVDYENEILARHLVKKMSEGKKLFVPIFMTQGYSEELAVEILKESQHPFFFDEQVAIKALTSFLKHKKYDEERD